jgi:hypothetical protein
MDCPRCRAGNATDARFCEDCGAHPAPACRRCGADVSPGKRFCRSCGAAFSAESPGAVPIPVSHPPPHLAEKILASTQAESALEALD